jgi:hypothetical protein
VYSGGIVNSLGKFIFGLFFVLVLNAGSTLGGPRPKVEYDIDEFREVLEEVYTDEETQNNISQSLKSKFEILNDEKSDIAILKSTVSETQELANDIFNKAKPTDRILANTCKRLIENWVSPFVKWLEKEELSLSGVDLENIKAMTQKLSAEQNSFESDPALKGLLEEHLARVAKVLKDLPPHCHLIYATPTKDHVREEEWVIKNGIHGDEGFLPLLLRHLESAGIRVKADFQMKVSDNPTEWSSRVRDGRPVILIGTESLREVVRDESFQFFRSHSAFLSEWVGVTRRIEGNIETARVAPWLISGTDFSSLPQGVPFFDARTEGYRKTLEKMVAQMYSAAPHSKRLFERNASQLDHMWGEFNAEYDRLTSGL